MKAESDFMPTNPMLAQHTEDRTASRGAHHVGNRGKGILFHSAFYASGNLLAAVCQAVGGVLMARFVGPDTLGLFNGFLLPQAYAPLLQLGVPDGFARQYPLCLGAGDRERAYTLAAMAQAWALILLVLSIAGFGFCAVVELWSSKPMRAAGWLTVGLGVAASFYGSGYLLNTYRTSSHFSRLAANRVIVAFAGLCAVALASWIGYYGLCVRYLIISGLTVWLLWIWRPIRVRPRWCYTTFKELNRIGLPILGNSSVVKVWAAANGTLILAFMGTKWMGLFAIANLVNTGLSVLPDAFAQVIYPRITQDFGAGKSPRDILARSVRLSVVASAVCLVAAAATWAALPWLVTTFVPKYVDGIAAAQWATLLAVMTAFKPMLTVFNVIGRQRLALFSTLLGILAHGAMLVPSFFGTLSIVRFIQAMLVGRLLQSASAYIMLRNIAAKTI